MKERIDRFARQLFEAEYCGQPVLRAMVTIMADWDWEYASDTELRQHNTRMELLAELIERAIAPEYFDFTVNRPIAMDIAERLVDEAKTHARSKI